MSENLILDKIHSTAKFEAAVFCSINFRTLDSLNSYIEDFLANPDILSPKKSFVFNKAMIHLVKESRHGIEKISHISYREWLILSNQLEFFKKINQLEAAETADNGLSGVVNRATILGLDKTYLLDIVRDNPELFPPSDTANFYRKFCLKMGNLELKTMGEDKAHEFLLKHWGEDINKSHTKEGNPLIYQLTKDKLDYEYIKFLMSKMKASFAVVEGAGNTRNPFFYIRTSEMLNIALSEKIDINYHYSQGNILTGACQYYEQKMNIPEKKQMFIDFIESLYKNNFNFEMTFLREAFNKSGERTEVLFLDYIKNSSTQCYEAVVQALPIIKQKHELESKIIAQREGFSADKSSYKV